MKIHIFITGVILVFAQFLSALDNNGGIISGVIKNYNKSSIKIDGHSIEVNTNGQFIYFTTLNNPVCVKIEYDKSFYLYLRSGDSINVIIDAEKDIKSVQTSGGNQTINKFLITEEYESAKVSAHFNQNFRDIVSLEEELYSQKIDKIWLPFEKRFESFIWESGVSDRYFVSTQRAIILYSKAQILMRYPGWHRYFSEDKNYYPSKNYYQFIDQLNLND